jgi:hypothetical protein
VGNLIVGDVLVVASRISITMLTLEIQNRQRESGESFNNITIALLNKIRIAKRIYNTN